MSCTFPDLILKKTSPYLCLSYFPLRWARVSLFYETITEIFSHTLYKIFTCCVFNNLTFTHCRFDSNIKCFYMCYGEQNDSFSMKEQWKGKNWPLHDNWSYIHLEILFKVALNTMNQPVNTWAPSLKLKYKLLTWNIWYKLQSWSW
jgi:hypothetical protein